MTIMLMLMLGTRVVQIVRKTQQVRDAVIARYEKKKTRIVGETVVKKENSPYTRKRC
jgi:hypothetical protein